MALITGIAWVLPYAVALDDLPLVPCTFLNVTGYPCPFCGLTRSFWAIAQGDWGLALRTAPFAFLLYGMTAVLFAWHSAALLVGLRVRSGVFQRLKSPVAVWLTVIVVLVNWGYRLAQGLK